MGLRYSRLRRNSIQQQRMTDQSETDRERQIREDEAYARRLQQQYDAEFTQAAEQHSAFETHDRRRRSSRLAGAVLQTLFSGAGPGPSFQMIFFPNGGSLVIRQHEQRGHHPLQFILSMDELEPMSYEDALRLQERLGNVNRGASQEQINATTKTTQVKQNDIPKEKQCVVCLSEFQPGEQVRTLRCNHSFHKDCVDTWLHRNKTCPICKREIVDTPPAGPPTSSHRV